MNIKIFIHHNNGIDALETTSKEELFNVVKHYKKQADFSNSGCFSLSVNMKQSTVDINIKTDQSNKPALTLYDCATLLDSLVNFDAIAAMF
jgi:hypothetical protein